jgi:hypothetical protein
MHDSVRRVIRTAALVGLPPALFISWNLFRPDANGIDVWGYVLGRDFVNFWTGAHLAVEGRVSEIYDLEGFHAAIREILNPRQGFMNFSYPPHALLPLAPLGTLPYGVSLAIWLGLGLGAYVWLVLSRVRAPRSLAFWLLLAPATLMNVVMAHAAPLLAVLMVGALLLVPTRPVLAGILIGLLTVKPQLGLLIPPVLILLGAWRTFAAASVTAVLFVAASVLAFGVDPWRDYFANTVPFQREVALDPNPFLGILLVTPYSGALAVGIPDGAAMLLHIAIAAGVALSLVPIVRSDRVRHDMKVAAVTLAALIVTPYSLAYDLAIPAAAIAIWLAARPDAPPPVVVAAAGLFWAAPFMGMVTMAFASLPLTQAALLALFVAVAREALGSPRTAQAGLEPRAAVA